MGIFNPASSSAFLSEAFQQASSPRSDEAALQADTRHAIAATLTARRSARKVWSCVRLADADCLFSLPPFHPQRSRAPSMIGLSTRMLAQGRQLPRVQKNALPNVLKSPTDKPVVKRFGWPAARRRVNPAATGAQVMHDAADIPTVVYKRHTLGVLRQKRRQPGHLPLGQMVEFGHHQSYAVLELEPGFSRFRYPVYGSGV